MIQLRIVLVLSALLAVAGCGSSPKRNFYTLQTPPPASIRNLASDSTQPDVIIGPVTLPDVVDRPQLVVRTGDNQLEISDVHRWAEPLKSEIADVLAADLSRDLAGARVSVQGRGTAGEPGIRVAVDVLRFESVLGSAATIEAVWAVRRKDAEQPVRGRSIVREAIQGDNYDALVAAHARALARISRDIAAMIRSGGG